MKGSEEGEGKRGLGITAFSYWIIALVLSYSLASPTLRGFRTLSARARAVSLKTCPVSDCDPCCVPSSTGVEMVEM